MSIGVQTWPINDAIVDDKKNHVRFLDSLVRALNCPAFHVDRANVNQLAVASGVQTPIQFNNDSTGVALDTHRYFDVTTFTYTPKVAGIYAVGGSVRFVAVGALTSVVFIIMKNAVIAGAGRVIAPGAVSPESNAITLLNMNGKTDFVRFDCLQDSGGPQDINGNVAATQAWGYRLPNLG